MHSLTSRAVGANTICAQIKQRITIPWLWQYHNLPGEPKLGGRCRSPFYHDKNPDFFISRDGSWFVDHGKPDHKGDVITFEQIAAGTTRRNAIGKLRELASLPENGARRLTVNVRSRPLEYEDSGKLQATPAALKLCSWDSACSGRFKWRDALHPLLPDNTISVSQGQSGFRVPRESLSSGSLFNETPVARGTVELA